MRHSISAVESNELELVNQNIHIEKQENIKIDHHDVVCVKPWGHEFLVYESSKIGIWCLTLLQGQSTSLHCHFKKDTLIIVLSGCAKVGFFNGEARALSAMESLFIPKKKFHSLASFSEKTCILEIEIFSSSIDFSDKNDLLRIHDQYHRKPIGYESSVQIIRDDLEKYGHFSLQNTNQSVEVHDVTIECKTISEAFQVSSDTQTILIKGSLQLGSILCKEGSLLSPDILYIPTESSLILSIRKPHWKEDCKIIYGPEHLTMIKKQIKDEKKSIVLTSGCFDILHVGHLHTLKTAKTLGDTLIVCLSSDKQIRILKGETRPINKFQDRLDLFKTIEYVDYIYPYEEEFIETEETLGTIMKTLDPDVWVKGTDYTVKAIQEKHPYLRKIHLVPLIKDRSTTNIVKKINKLS